MASRTSKAAAISLWTIILGALLGGIVAVSIQGNIWFGVLVILMAQGLLIFALAHMIINASLDLAAEELRAEEPWEEAAPADD